MNVLSVLLTYSNWFPVSAVQFGAPDVTISSVGTVAVMICGGGPVCGSASGSGFTKSLIADGVFVVTDHGPFGLVAMYQV